MRFYVFDSEPEAHAAVAAIDARARVLYAANGYTVDAAGRIIGKRAGVDAPEAARTVTWDVPRQRADGRWIVAHTETCPGHDVVADPITGTLVWQFVSQDITAPAEEFGTAWFPEPEGL